MTHIDTRNDTTRTWSKTSADTAAQITHGGDRGGCHFVAGRPADGLECLSGGGLGHNDEHQVQPGQHQKGDGYSLATVILAAVLFFVGMSGRMKWYPLRIIMVTIGGVLLITAVVRFIML